MAAAIVPLLVNVRQQRQYRHTNHVQVLNDHEMFERYRFTNHGVDFLVDLLEEDLKRPTNRSFALTPKQQLLIALRYFATGAMFQVIGDTMGYDKGTVSRCVHRVANAIVSHLNEFVRWPTADEKRKISNNFYQVAGFPNVIGCIDGTHVRLQAPSRDEASFVNRKGYHSISVQAVCDDEGRFTSVNASWPGSCHDSYIFRTSGLCRLLEQNNNSFSDGVLLGDSGYPCRSFLMTPFLVTETEPKAQYQQGHTKTRVTIERAFGRLKRRFHVLHSEIRLAPAKVCRVICACVVLFNIVILLNEPVLDDMIEDGAVELANEDAEDAERDGSTVRNFIIQQYFS